MKAGKKLKSTVCDTEVMVIRTDGRDVSCGGAPMADQPAVERGEIDPAFAGGTKIGKRYVDAAATVELLCVKPGQGTLSLTGEPLTTKDAKPLPSSD